MKYDLPQTQEYINKYMRYQELYIRGNKTSSEVAELIQLDNDLTDYKFKASDYNELIKYIDDHKSDKIVHKQTYQTIQSGLYANAEGGNTIASGEYSHAEGNGTTASGKKSHAEGDSSIASGEYSHASGYKTIASGYNAYTEGYGCTAFGDYNHAEGYYNVAGSQCSHVEGSSNTSVGGDVYNIISRDFILNTITIDTSNHNIIVGDALLMKQDEGSSKTGIAVTAVNGAVITVDKSISNFWVQIIKPKSNLIGACHSEGIATVATESGAHAEGFYTFANGIAAHAEGMGTKASMNSSHAMGRYNKDMLGDKTQFVITNDAFVLGNGSKTARSNAFRITFDGKVYGLSAFNSTGADYAEYFEWEDGNPNNEDRIGYFATLDGENIRKANSFDNYILGIISANSSVIGDSCNDDWHDKYLTDEWGRRLTQQITVQEVLDDKGNIIMPTHIDTVFVLNPDWTPNELYISREQRKEWSTVGMLGKLLVRDDGTCQVNGYCKPNDEGIATASEQGYKVMKRIKDNIILVLFR